MRLITWNVNKRRDISAQINALIAYQPDVVALQEVTLANLPRFSEAFAAIGLPHVAHSHHAEAWPRRSYVLLASRYPLTLKPQISANLTYPQGALFADVHLPHVTCHIANIHIPSIGSYAPEVKFGFMEGIYEALAQPSDVPRVLCGDFNAPQLEMPDGELITFGQTRRADGVYRTVKKWEREDRAERQLLRGLADFDLCDCYRLLNGYQQTDCSWYAYNRGRAFGFRLDHVLASRAMNAVSARYLHELRENRLSDHSALEVVFAP